ncbi:Fructose-2,6-bisphosphate 2-phosphatase [Bertholletia excelsa]
MGASQSAQVVDEEEEEDEHDEEEEDDDDDNGPNQRRELIDNNLVKKVLEQEPEMLPCHASASPLSPQFSSFGTPRLGPSIKVWDPYNVLAPPPPLPPPPAFSRSFSSDVVNDDRTITEVFLINHGEWHMNLRPDLIAGRCPEAALTPNGKRQARALAVFLKSHGVRFNAVYTSPLDRARATAISVCQEMNIEEEQIQSSEALLEMSQGHWEGCHRSEIYTSELMRLMDRFQPDFCAPSGESLRQVEFRMVQFLNGTILGLPEKLRSDFSPPSQSEGQEFSCHTSHILPNSTHDRDGPSLPPPHWDLLHRHRHGLTKKKSGKSRLQIVTTTGDHEADDEMSPREPPHSQTCLNELNVRSSSSSCISNSIGVFTHSVPIKCLLTGLLGCSPAMSHRICVEDSSITVLQHSWKTGWQIKRLNDTAHLRLL